ncbi:hypothetical protein JI667_16560 [Bacillus sp. NTK074B]|uniref:M14 family metallocarboxypeptidase n=1 Tax=Bacillus sp. NTK074B TaxID=2802174 RepID=UPI001A90C57F|nr:hypothetical protein [Bacillus sp. NTK074B]
MKEDIALSSQDKVDGILHKGSKVYVGSSESEGEYVFSFGEIPYTLKTTEIAEVTDETLSDLTNDPSAEENHITVPEGTVVFDHITSTPIITLKKETVLPLLSLSEEETVVLIGGREGILSSETDKDPEEKSEEDSPGEVKPESEPTTDSSTNDPVDPQPGTQSKEENVKSEEDTKEEPVKSSESSNDVTRSFQENDTVFEVTEETEVFIKEDGKLVPVATLAQGEMFHRERDYTSWHMIYVGNKQAFVKKEATKSIENPDRHPPKSADGGNLSISMASDAPVYDNSTGSLVRFATLNSHTDITAVHEYSSWYAVELGGRLGYVAKESVEKQFSQDTKFFKVTEDSQLIYEKVSGQLVVVGKLKKDQVYPRTDDYTAWHKIKLGNRSAFIKKEGTVPSDGKGIKNIYNETSHSNIIKMTTDAVVYDNTSGELIPFGVINEGVTYTVIKEYGSWYAIQLAGRLGYIAKSDAVAEFTSNTTYFEVTADELPVYDNSTGELVQVGSLSKGQVYPRLKDYTSWHMIEFGDIMAYVPKDGTRPSEAHFIKNESGNVSTNHSVAIKHSTLVYDNTSGSLIPYANVLPGRKLSLLNEYTSWWEVEIAGRVGFIHKEDAALSFSPSIQYFQVTTDTPIYTKSGSSLKVVGYLKEGQQYPRTSDFTSWNGISFNGKAAYVKKQDTIPLLSHRIKNISHVPTPIGSMVTTKKVKVYDNSGSNLVPFAELEGDTSYSVNEVYTSWVKISIAGREGFVDRNEVKLNVLLSKNIVNPKKIYTYTQMQRDIWELRESYPGLVQTKIIGKSVDGRNLYAIKLGRGSTEIMINASHHAREHMTTNLAMEMLDVYAQYYVDDKTVKGYSAKDILDKTSIWFVPMVNPDGVSLVQYGSNSAKNPNYVRKLNNGSSDFSSWKANIRGVDLNRQYPANWSIQRGTTEPGPQDYKGPKPLSEPETQAMYNFTMSRDFKTALAYHTSGEMIYWSYELANKNLMNTSKRIAEMIREQTGYRLMPPAPEAIGAYDDWFISQFGRPAFTPEISPYAGPNPVPLKNYDAIWQENKAVGLMLALEAYENRNNR